MIIYRKRINDCWYDSWEVQLLFPKIGRWDTEDFWEQENKNYGVDLATDAVYTKEASFWSIRVRLLGFGVWVNRQTGY